MTSPTRHKALEAAHFLSMMKQTFQDDDLFSYNLSAFLSAARSITFFMQKQYNRRAGFAEWYCPRQFALSADAELKYLNEARVESLKKETVAIGATREKSFKADVILVASAGATHSDKADAEPPPQIPPTTFRRFFPKFKGIDVLQFCDAQLARLTALVDQCESRFP